MRNESTPRGVARFQRGADSRPSPSVVRNLFITMVKLRSNSPYASAGHRLARASSRLTISRHVRAARKDLERLLLQLHLHAPPPQLTRRRYRPGNQHENQLVSHRAGSKRYLRHVLLWSARGLFARFQHDHYGHDTVHSHSVAIRPPAVLLCSLFRHSRGRERHDFGPRNRRW